jgi:hypothetical protein
LRRMLIVVVVIALGWAAVQRQRSHRPFENPVSDPVPATPLTDVPRQADVDGKFSCDGRVYCSQMTSCAEAKYFLAHCPGTKMDGDGDGIPCERQFCGNH